MSDSASLVNTTFDGSLSDDQIVARLLLHEDTWMVRRKLVITVLDECWHRKQLSVDVRLPPELTAWARAQAQVTVPVPITMLYKAPEATMDFDLRDARGHALSLPRLVENLTISGRVLRDVARLVNPHESEAVNSRAVDRVVAAATSKYPECGDYLSASGVFRPENKTDILAPHLREHPRFRWLSLRLIYEALIVVQLPADSLSHIVKLSFLARNDPSPDDSRARPTSGRARFAISMPFTLELLADDWACGAFHLEAQAPEDLEIIRARITRESVDESRGAKRSVPPRLPPSKHWWRHDRGTRPVPPPGGRNAGARNRIERTHLYIGEDDVPGRADLIGAEMDFRVQRRGFLSIAAWSSLLLLVFLGMTFLLVTSMAEHLEASTVLLGGGATIAVTAMMQTSRHSLAARLLGAVRYAVLCMAFVTFCDLIWLFALDVIRDAPLEWEGVTISYDHLKRLVPAIAGIIGLACAAICMLARFSPRVR
jgi:hypothetical protein